MEEEPTSEYQGGAFGAPIPPKYAPGLLVGVAIGGVAGFVTFWLTESQVWSTGVFFVVMVLVGALVSQR